MKKSLFVLGGDLPLDTLSKTELACALEEAGVPPEVASFIIENLADELLECDCPECCAKRVELSDPGTCDDPRCTCTSCGKERATGPKPRTGSPMRGDSSTKTGGDTMARCAGCGMPIPGVMAGSLCLHCFTADAKAKADGKIHGSCLREAHNIINGKRQDMYGSPEMSHDRIANYWNIYLGDKLNSNLSAADVAMMMILFKVARQQNKPKRDNLVDIAGYVGILETILNS